MNKIQEAYEQGLRIKQINWCSDAWIKKLTITKSIDESGKIYENSEIDFDFDTHPSEWEIFGKQPQTDTIVQAVQSDLQARSERGIAKYGTTLDRNDLSEKDWLQHAYEEALDLALYLKKLINTK